jgi:hypothetical protein
MSWGRPVDFNLIFGLLDFPLDTVGLVELHRLSKKLGRRQQLCLLLQIGPSDLHIVANLLDRIRSLKLMDECPFEFRWVTP